MAVRVLIADDHELARRGLKALFEGTDIQVVAEVSTPSDLVKSAVGHRPDVILLDLRFDGQSGLDALPELTANLPKSRVVIFSAYENTTYVARAAALGAGDYILKGISRRNLIRTIQAAAAGKLPTPWGVMTDVAKVMADTSRAADHLPLTGRECQVLRHIGLGLSNKEIAQSLQISIETIKEHVQHILRKIKASDRTQAAVWALQKKLL